MELPPTAATGVVVVVVVVVVVIAPKSLSPGHRPAMPSMIQHHHHMNGDEYVAA